jgi:beta-xylosidase
MRIRTIARATALAIAIWLPGNAMNAPNATYTNPVYAHDFPDPFILTVGGVFYAYATETRGYGFQVMQSPDLVHWTHKGTIFRPPWSSVHLWAPEVLHYRGRFYMTYSAKNPSTGKREIGVAVADSPLGPFTDKAILARPAQNNPLGVIDATLFVDADGAPYMLYSEEEPRRIVLRRLAPDLMSAVTDPEPVVQPDRPWEFGVTEAPTLIRRNGRYHLFFSVGGFQSDDKAGAVYAVAHAVADRITGPYKKDDAPLLHTVPGRVYSPGHQCIVRLPSGEDWIAYHAWDAQNEPHYGSNPLGRTLRIDRLIWRGDAPYVDGPSTEPRPAPDVRPRPRDRAR